MRAEHFREMPGHHATSTGSQRLHPSPRNVPPLALTAAAATAVFSGNPPPTHTPPLHTHTHTHTLQHRPTQEPNCDLLSAPALVFVVSTFNRDRLVFPSSLKQRGAYLLKF